MVSSPENFTETIRRPLEKPQQTAQKLLGRLLQNDGQTDLGWLDHLAEYSAKVLDFEKALVTTVAKV